MEKTTTKATGKILTESAKVRISYGLKQKEVADAIGISGPVYSLHESQKRKVSKERSEKLFYQIHHASRQLIEERKRKAEDLELNTYKPEGYKSVEESIEDELNFELHYVTLTEDLFQEILMKFIFKGKTVVRASAETGVDEDVLAKRLKKEGISFEMGDNWSKLLGE